MSIVERSSQRLLWMAETAVQSDTAARDGSAATDERTIFRLTIEFGQSYADGKFM